MKNEKRTSRLKKVNIPSIADLNNNLQKLQAEGYDLITTELSVQAALKKKQEEIFALKKRIQELDTFTENGEKKRIQELDTLTENSEMDALSRFTGNGGKEDE